MENKVIDVSVLTPKQIAIIEEIVAIFKVVAKQNDSSQNLINQQDTEEEKLKILHEEFDWLIADLGVKKQINRSDIYGIKKSE